MARSPSERRAAALAAARALQEGIAGFNAAHNRLPTPFRLRCGISTGEVPVRSAEPLGLLASPVIDQAAALQKRVEPGGIALSPAAAAEAGVSADALRPLPEPVLGETGFAWLPPGAENASG